MKVPIAVKISILCLMVCSVWYSYSGVFVENSMETNIAPSGSKEICINNSSDFFDMWNNRYLHIDSSSIKYTLYSKKTIIVSVFNDKKVSDIVIKTSGKNPYAVDVRMYFSRCYIVKNDDNENTLHIYAYTYRNLCYVNALVILFITTFLSFYPKYFLKEIIFFGICILSTLISFATYLSYLVSRTMYLPGVKVVNGSVLASLPFILFYSFLMIQCFSYILRILLNYYHFSISSMHHMPHIISTVGPIIGPYQSWVIGIYVVVAFFVIPFRVDGIAYIFVFGCILLIVLEYFGYAVLYRNLLSGCVIATMILTILPYLWKNGYFYMFFPHPSRKTKVEREKSLKAVIDD